MPATDTEVQAGPELDAEIARLLWGIEVEKPAPPFSTKIEDAWLVVETMRERGWHLTMANGEEEAWTAQFDDGQWREIISEGNDTAPLAICHAALKALEDAG